MISALPDPWQSALPSSIRVTRRVTRIVISHAGMNDRLCKSAPAFGDLFQSASFGSFSEGSVD
jgi:hypothetical protein